MTEQKPRILMLVDRPNWAYDICAQEIARNLKNDFEVEIRYVRERPKLNPAIYDLLYVFFWGERYHQKFGFEPERTIKEVSSHRWQDDPQYGSCTPSEFTFRHLSDSDTVICTSQRLYKLIDGVHTNTYHSPNGFSTTLFRLTNNRSGPMTIGWAGNIKDEVKGYKDILEPACRNKFKLIKASGSMPHSEMNKFYNKLDLYVVCSRHEGSPLTLIEAMAGGCFPVCTDVGIVPELITHGKNGYIVSERTPEAFAEAFSWCEANLDDIRKAGEENARQIRAVRSWDVCAQHFKKVLLDVYGETSQPRFRNDDVSWDTSLENFRKFCDVFRKYGLRQVHGITLHGCTNTLYKFRQTPAEYEGYDSVSRLDNDNIRHLSKGKSFEERQDLIEYIANGPDEIALHGLYHTDYSKMSYNDQYRDIVQGIVTLKRLFPNKHVRYFIPPFNRINKFTPTACREIGLRVLTTEGHHLEEELSNLILRRNTWYRYHHHRFYPESQFHYFDLNISKLDTALAQATARGLQMPMPGKSVWKILLQKIMSPIMRKQWS